MLRASIDKAHLGPLASRAKVTYLPTIETNYMQITLLNWINSSFHINTWMFYYNSLGLFTDSLSGSLGLI